MKFFNSDQNKYCKYCKYSVEGELENTVFCAYKGTVDSTDCCRKFEYDILKRKPHRISISDNYNSKDFSL